MCLYVYEGLSSSGHVCLCLYVQIYLSLSSSSHSLTFTNTQHTHTFQNRAVKALKKTYETDTFEVLNTIRSTLGQRMDDKYIHLKGKIMTDIEEKHAAAQQAAVAAVAAAGVQE